MTINVKDAKSKVVKYANVRVLCCNIQERKDWFYCSINSFKVRILLGHIQSLETQKCAHKIYIFGKIRVSTQKSGRFFRNDTGKVVFEKVRIA